MLYLRAVVTDFEDIDLFIAEANIEQVKSIMSTLGEITQQPKDRNYATKHFLEYTVDGVEIDIMSGFTIICEDKSHYFPLKDINKSDVIEIEGIKIYLEQLSVWLNYYKLTKRLDKVDLIEAHLKNIAA